MTVTLPLPLNTSLVMASAAVEVQDVTLKTRVMKSVSFWEFSLRSHLANQSWISIDAGNLALKELSVQLVRPLVHIFT